jgi:hypothetical protein
MRKLRRQRIFYTQKTTLDTLDEWNQAIVEDGEDSGGRTINQIECTVEEQFSVKIADEEVKLLMDERGGIRYENALRWYLPRIVVMMTKVYLKFKQQGCEIIQRSESVLEEGYKPRYYNRDRVITGGHVARFYGACLRRMANGGRSIDQIFSTREILDDVPLIQAAMTKGASEDSTTCLHYSDDWDPKDDGVWDDLYNDPKVVADLSTPTAIYRLKHGQLEDGYSKVCSVFVVVVVVVVVDIMFRIYY